MSRKDRRRRPHDHPTAVAANRKAVLDPLTVAGQDAVLARFAAHARTEGYDPDRATAHQIRDWLHAQPHDLSAGALAVLLTAVKRRRRDNGTETTGLFRPANDYVTAAKKDPARRRAAPAAPLLAQDAAALADSPHTAHPATLARDRAALLGLAENPDAADGLFQTTPALPPDDPGHGPLRLDVHVRPGRAARHISLSDTPRAPGLPSPAEAARHLHQHVPPHATRMFGIAAKGHAHDQPARPITRTNTIRSHVLRALANAARRAQAPWTGPDSAHRLTPHQLAAVHQALDPAALPDAVDRVIATAGHHTGLRGVNLRRLQDPDTHRTARPDGTPIWQIRLDRTKKRPHDGTILELEPGPDPRLDPVDALDRLQTARRLAGDTGTHALPGTDRHGKPTGKPIDRNTFRKRLERNAKRAGLPGKTTTRSIRKGTATQADLDGKPLPHIAQTLGDDLHNTGTYITGTGHRTLRF